MAGFRLFLFFFWGEGGGLGPFGVLRLSKGLWGLRALGLKGFRAFGVLGFWMCGFRVYGLMDVGFGSGVLAEFGLGPTRFTQASEKGKVRVWV